MNEYHDELPMNFSSLGIWNGTSLNRMVTSCRTTMSLQTLLYYVNANTNFLQQELSTIRFLFPSLEVGEEVNLALEDCTVPISWFIVAHSLTSPVRFEATFPDIVGWVCRVHYPGTTWQVWFVRCVSLLIEFGPTYATRD